VFDPGHNTVTLMHVSARDVQVHPAAYVLMA
jgi:hypothetical protein